VRVKVLDVDVPRKRISLTLRLDDDAASIAAPKRGGAPASRPKRPERTERPERTDAPLANTALADALRRAGLDGTSDRESRRR